MIKETEKISESENQIHIKEKKSIIRRFLFTLLDLRDNMMEYDELDNMMREQTVIHGANMWILMLAILIASIGLNMNSTAVIIGAMLISPLMSGIMSMGYSVAVRDISLLLSALRRFVTQVCICLATSVIYFSVSPLTTPTAEMIARTSPTVWDVLIAVFGGFAGMIGHTRTKHSNVIPGVAIATALMPPLCTAGYGIATGQLRFFLGAFYLFLINTLFIAISTTAVVLILRVPYHRSVSARAQRRVNVIIGIIAVALVIPSVIIASSTVHDSYIDNNIAHYLEREFSFSDTQIVKSETDRQNKIISVSLVGSTLNADIISMLESRLDSYSLEGYTLSVTQNVLAEGGNNDKIQIILQEKTISELEKRAADKDQIIKELRDTVLDYEEKSRNAVDFAMVSEKAEKIFSHLSECRTGIVSDSRGDTAVLTAVSSSEMSDYEKESVKQWLMTEAGTEAAEIIITVVSSENDE